MIGWLASLPLAVAYLLWQPKTTDLAAQVHFADVGWAMWDPSWYGGHHPFAYSVITPWLMSWLGVALTGALATVAASWLFARLVASCRRPRLASVWFAVAAWTNLVSGRVTFAVGMALGLAALVVVDGGIRGARTPRKSPSTLAAAGALAVACALASPVAALFLGISAAALFLTSRRREGLVLGVAATASVIAVAWLFPNGGEMPFHFASAVPALLAALVVAFCCPGVVRTGAALTALATALAFIVPSPIGSNVTRLALFFAGPVLVAHAPSVHPVIALSLAIWQVPPVWGDIAKADEEPGRSAAYFTELFEVLDELQPQRVYVLPMRNHWESVHVARRYPMAGGWNRQLDVTRGPSAPDAFDDWLTENGVDVVAAHDAPPDRLASDIAQLLARGGPQDVLQRVSAGEHWNVWRVASRASARQRWSPWWTVDEGCVADDGGWLRVEGGDRPRVRLSWRGLGDRDGTC